jgi:hypothetical protein
MKSQPAYIPDEFDEAAEARVEAGDASEQDLWLSRLVPDFN